MSRSVGFRARCAHIERIITRGVRIKINQPAYKRGERAMERIGEKRGLPSLRRELSKALISRENGLLARPVLSLRPV